MKRLISLAVSLLMAALFFFTAALAQEPVIAPSPVGKKEPARPILDQPGPFKWIEVIEGGNLALIAERCGHRQTEWPDLYNINQDILPKPYLMNGIGGTWYCLVLPKQRLRLPVGWSYNTLNPEYVVPFPPAPEEARSPEETMPPTPSEAEEPFSLMGRVPNIDRSPWFLDPFVWALIFLVLAVVAILTVIEYRRLIRRRDPSRYPAMITGGLSSNLNVAAIQLHTIYGRRYNKIERGRLVRHRGCSRILIKRMAFGDGISRPAYLNQGDEVYRGALPDGGFNYFLRSCGNLGPEFEIPPGWSFLLLQLGNIDRTVYESPMTATAAIVPDSVSHPEPTPEPAPELASVPVPEPAQELKPEAIPPIPPAPPVPPIPPAPPVPPAPVFPAEPAPAPDPEPESESEPEPAPKPTTEAEPSVAVAEIEKIKSRRKVKVTMGDLLIDIIGNGEVPDTKVETDDGYTFVIQQKK